MLSPVAASPPCPVMLDGTSSISVLSSFHPKIGSREEKKKIEKCCDSELIDNIVRYVLKR